MMSLSINTNMASLFAQNSLSRSQGLMASAVAQLSSGLRINSSMDDASVLAISKSLLGQQNAIAQANHNVTQVINELQTMDIGLSHAQDILLRLKQLATEGKNDSLSGSQKMNIATEVNNLNNTLNNLAVSSSYNGNNLLATQVAHTSSITTTTTTTTPASAVASNTTNLGGTGLSILSVSPSTGGTSAAAGTYTLLSSTSSGGAQTVTPGAGLSFTSALTDANKVGGINMDYLSIASSGVGTGTYSFGSVTQTSGTFIPAVINMSGPSASSSSATLTGLVSSTTPQTLTFNINGGTINVTLSTLDPRAGSAIRNSNFLNYLTGKSFSVTGGASSYSVQLKDANNNLIDTQTLTNNQSAINFSNGIAINLSSNTLSASQIQTAITANSNSITITAASSQTTSTTTTTTTNGDAPQTIQVGASTSDTTSVSGLNIQTNSSGTVNEMTTVGSTVATLVGYDATTTNTSWNSSFNNLSTSIDNAVDYISSQRGAIGAQMNALGYQSQNLIATSANIEAANSTITSTDYAQAIAYITKQQIMQQASTAMLAQANLSGKIILDLCQSSAMRLMI